MSHRGVPPIRRGDLKDHADHERIDRIWDRLEPDLSGREREKTRVTGTVFGLVAATAAAFALGVWVGGSTTPEKIAAPTGVITPETASTPKVLAAGRIQASYPLPGGGTITLSPGATIELDRGEDDALTLRLLRGEASVDTAGVGRRAEISLIAEDARLSSSADSVLFVRRNEADIDVRVASGSARLSWPLGTRELSSGEGLEAVPMRAVAPVSRVEDDDPPPHRVTSQLPRELPRLPLVVHPDAPTVAIAAPDWRTKYNAGELSQALELLRQQPGGIEGAINAARNAAELAAISDIARAKGGDPSAALTALTQLVDRFPGDPYAEIAAYTLGGMYEKMGQADKAQKYFERARSLKGVLAEDALCKQIRAEHFAGRKDEAARMGKEYSNKYPDGRCKEDVERILAGEELAREAPETEASSDAGAGDAGAL